MSSPNSFTAKYKLRGSIGSGGNAVVRKCFRRGTTDVRAAKCISISQTPEYLLYREARISKVMKHQNIVRFYESFAEVHRHILVFEYVKGGRILDYVGFGSSKNIEDVPYFFKQIIAAVQYFHQKNIIHRDLTPANILLTSRNADALVKVIDFGLALEVSAQGFYGDVGTPSHRSPEVVKGEIYGKPADIWACGVILYEMLSGEKPFSDDSHQDLYRKISEARIQFVSSKWGHVPEDARNLVSEMLCRDQNKRITTDQAMVHPYLNGVPKLKSSVCIII